jgi:hypothetical protein
LILVEWNPPGDRAPIAEVEWLGGHRFSLLLSNQGDSYAFSELFGIGDAPICSC